MSEDVTYRLSNYEETPPQRVWDAVEAGLNETQPVLQEKLYAYTATPPLNAWDKIERGLSAPADATIRPVRNHLPVFLKYAAAIAALVMIIIMVNLALKPNKPADEIAHNKPVSVPVIKDTHKIVIVDPSPADKTISRPGVKPAQPPVNAADKSRYLTVAQNDGTKVRLSRKVLPVINCAENTASTSWSRCKENIQALQSKMASSINASADFGGLLDMLKDLEEKK